MSLGSVYPSTTAVPSELAITTPRLFTMTLSVVPVPKIPLSSGSVYPASTTSKHPSLSESKSSLFTSPSPSVSTSPSHSS